MNSAANNLHILRDKTKSLTGREPFINLFYDTVAKDGKDNLSVLSYYGTKGIGKSSLRKEICDKLEIESEIIWSSIDFNISNNRELDGFLVSLRNQLNQKYNITFPSFDIAYAFYLQNSPQHLSLSECNSLFIEGKSPLSSILGTLNELPSKGFIPTLSTIFTTPGNLFNDWWKHKGKKYLANIPLISQKDLINNLPVLWANDLNDFIEDSRKKVIIFLDSFDTLNKDTKTHDTNLNNEVLQKWILRLKEALFVIFSENELLWSVNNKIWSSVIKSVHLERFSESDMEKYLNNLGIDDNDVINTIIKESNGLPYVLNLAVDIFKEIEFRKKRKPKAIDFEDINNQSVDKLLSLLNKYEIDTLKLLSFSLGWNQQLLFSLISEFNTGFPESEIKDLCRFSFIKETEIPGFWIMDEWIAVYLRTKEESQKQKEVHKFLFEYYNNSIKSIDFKNISDTDKKSIQNVYHYAKNSLEINDFTDWFLNLSKKFRIEGQYRFMLPLLDELMKILKETNNDKSKEYADTLNSIGIYYKDLGKYKEAESVLKQAIEILENIKGKESKEVAECMVNLADVIFCQGNFSEAEPLYIKSIVLLNPLSQEESSFSSHSLINVAILFARQGKYDEAISLFEKTLVIKLKTHGEGSPDVSKIYTNIANIEFDRKNYEKAESLYRKVLDWENKYYGENHPETRIALINLGNVLIEEKKYNESKLLYEKAKEIIEKHYGNEHPDYAMTLNNLAYVNYIAGNYETSEIYYLEALNIYKNILGNEHPDIATLYTNLGNLCTSLKKYDEAEKYLKSSLDIKSKKLGFDNPETANTYKGFANLYETIGNNKLTLFYLKKYEKILLKQAQFDNQELLIIKEKISFFKK